MSKVKNVKTFNNVMEQVLIAKGYEIKYESHNGDSTAIMNVVVEGEVEVEKMRKIIKRVVKLLGSSFYIDSDNEVVFVKPNGYETIVHNVHSIRNFRFYNY